MNALQQEWTPVDGLRAFDGVTVGNRRLHMAYWDGADGGGDATLTVYVDGSEVGSVGLDGWMLCALTERKSTPEERMAEAAERQAAALERANELAEQRNAKMERIAVAVEYMATGGYARDELVAGELLQSEEFESWTAGGTDSDDDDAF